MPDIETREETTEGKKDKRCKTERKKEVVDARHA
jgi:hypothetical protein